MENVLWRIQNGELDFHVKIKAIVLFVGTNNIDCTPHEILEGILEIIKEIKHRLGKVHIVLPVNKTEIFLNFIKSSKMYTFCYYFRLYCQEDNIKILIENVTIM